MKVTHRANGDHVCEHGVSVDVHCCGCHSGFLFDPASCVCLKVPDRVQRLRKRHRVLRLRLYHDYMDGVWGIP